MMEEAIKCLKTLNRFLEACALAVEASNAKNGTEAGTTKATQPTQPKEEKPARTKKEEKAPAPAAPAAPAAASAVTVNDAAKEAAEVKQVEATTRKYIERFKEATPNGLDRVKAILKEKFGSPSAKLADLKTSAQRAAYIETILREIATADNGSAPAESAAADIGV